MTMTIKSVGWVMVIVTGHGLRFVLLFLDLAPIVLSVPPNP